MCFAHKTEVDERTCAHLVGEHVRAHTRGAMASLAGSYIEMLAIPFSQRSSLVPVNWALVEDIRREGDANNTVCTALRIFTQTMFRGGFALEVVRAGRAELADPWFLEHVVATEWMPAIEKMLKHFFYFGFACVVYPQPAAGGAAVPRVLDVSEYTLYFKREADGGRSYVVYSQPATPYSSRVAALPEPIANARLLFVGEGPDAHGAPTSRLRDVLPSLLVASELWENVRAADYDRTHPAYIYEKPTTGGAGGVTGAIISASTRVFDTADNDAHVHDALLEHEENAEARFEAMSAIAAARAYNRTPQRRLVDKASGGIVYAKAPLPWEKHKSVPVGSRLAAPPVPQMLPFFADAYRILRTHVCQAFGVPGELLGDGGGGADHAAAASEVTSSMLRDSVIAMQQKIGPHIATLYMDVFRDKYMSEFDDAVLSVMHTSGELMSAEDLAKLRPRFFVRVTFLNTPALRYDDVLALREARVIGRETAQTLALGVFNLPPDMALSRADEESERRHEAEAEAEAARLLAEATATVLATPMSTPGAGPKPKPKPKTTAGAKRARNQ